MKNSIIASLACAFISTTTFANSFCELRQEVEAHIAAAKLWNVSADQVVVLVVEPGAWTEAVGFNTGSDTVTVALKNKRDENGEPVTKSIVVHAKQIGMTEDCTIIRTEEAK